MPNSGGYFTYQDFDREPSTFSFRTGAITVPSLPGFLTQFGALRTATNAIVLGTAKEEGWIGDRTPLSNTPPTDPNAQRERKWLVQFEDTTQFFDAPLNAIPNEGYHKNFTVEIPTAKVTGYGGGSDSALIVNTDDADLAHPQIAAFITAFEAIARTPYGGTVNVTRIRVVGRNL